MLNWVTPPKSLMRYVGRAIRDYQMIQEGDRVLLGLSGGKDSLSLLHILICLSRYTPLKFDLAALTVDPQIEGYDPSVLKDYLAQLEVPFFYRAQPIVEQAKARMRGDCFCAYCSRMKRGIMYEVARQEGYPVLALAQHLDDLAESFLMSAFYNGRLQTMKAHYTIDAGDLRVIRPLVYARERQTAEFAKSAHLPIVADNCPAYVVARSQRAHMKALLAREESHNSHLFRILLHTLRPLMVRQPPLKNSLPFPNFLSQTNIPIECLTNVDEEA